MTLREYCDTLPEGKQIAMALMLTRHLLPAWSEYAEHHTLSYRDTVAGLTHTVPRQLLGDSICEIEVYLSSPRLLRMIKRKDKLLKLYSSFSDPVIALQDTDWELPPALERSFYSVYNLLGVVTGKKKTVFGDPAVYVSINQAIEALDTGKILSEAQIKKIIEQAEQGY